ncbi:hypothetical protein B5G43_02130 [Flavonifractor sp. An92]|uniref:hypothetical protein n=1 Tax=Flavonifractor sp. An92 TaxID=1965666 RepID=UPI000B3A0589|nr:MULTISPECIES: hypothetical protein [unclassified Flavonifractor]OUN08203.1 hypothetical protein B5G43_02130 [Flavonifractor sp. An92]OUQ25794.1 hypothetical protein B5E80_04195 [Flavonifractor sp. An135]
MRVTKLLRAAVLAAALLCTTGCSAFLAEEDLYQLPEMPKDYQDLTSQTQAVIDQGAEYSAPLTGENIQNIQLQDLDGDGESESALAFFRMGGEEKPLKIYIYRQHEDSYELQSVIEGAGTNIHSVSYVNLDDDPDKEIVVSWQISEKVYLLAAYSVAPDQVVELFSTDYTSYQIMDMDQNGDQEIVVLKAATEGGGDMELYNFNGGMMQMQSSAPLSAGITDVAEGELRRGYLKGLVPALFLTCAYGETGNSSITDIFAWDTATQTLSNVTLDKEQGFSASTWGYYSVVGPTDIDKDSIMEIPISTAIQEYRQTSSASNFWINRWYKYDIKGTAWPVFTTYYNNQDGWYLILPDHWLGNITLSRNDAAGGGERAVVFSYWEGDNSVEPIPFLTIYRLSGSNRETRAKLPGRFLLGDSGEDEPSILYAAKFEENSWDCGLDEESLKESFQVIRADWDGLS